MSVDFEPLRAQVTELNPILGKTKVRSKVQQNKTDYCSNKKAQSGGWGIKQGKTGCSLGIDLGFCPLPLLHFSLVFPLLIGNEIIALVTMVHTDVDLGGRRNGPH